MHGTYKNISGLEEIVEKGLMSNLFINGRVSKYIGSVGVWNLRKACYLKEYIDFYSDGTFMVCGLYKDGINTGKNSIMVIPYDKMNDMLSIISRVECHMWIVEQTKEARFMPSFVQDRVQIGIIFNGNNTYIKALLNGDILNPNIINDEDVKEFINPEYYNKFVRDRKNKDAFFTDRESAILFGIPGSFIEGILVRRNYEKDEAILERVKELLPNAYICNLDGIIIRN